MYDASAGLAIGDGLRNGLKDGDRLLVKFGSPEKDNGGWWNGISGIISRGCSAFVVLVADVSAGLALVRRRA
ncbi:hypothetical protein [Bifidobacterium sp. ESL0704]|uniref:hypothetical protein n=1 Tax=Bifidobacterium sp. ESL0704 TaxID=2983219 RepID=UPI0023FA3122|nr:hypothetical protein [Bifidobacterium sp. ESL0704]WEV53147.1 hypothetical protein OZX64_01200 [Bifidobacterium sp. ESL0704]